MRLDVIFSFALLMVVEGTTDTETALSRLNSFGSTGNKSTVVHSRRKRYIVFPKGASLQILLELLIHVPTVYKVFVGPTLQIAWPIPTHPFRTPANDPTSTRRVNGDREKYKIYQNIAAAFDLMGSTIGLAWQLPDDPMIYSDHKKKHKIYKRNAFKKMEAFMRPGGADGRQCVLKALCESGQRTPSKKNFVREILHKIFSYSEKEEDTEETHEDKIYRKAHQSTNQDCYSLYPRCKFSVFRAIQ